MPLKAVFSIVCAFRLTKGIALGVLKVRLLANPRPFTPIEISLNSAYPFFGWWQVAHATSLSPESTGSKKRSFPNSTLFALGMLFFG